MLRGFKELARFRGPAVDVRMEIPKSGEEISEERKENVK